jgi:hypothetical protein
MNEEKAPILTEIIDSIFTPSVNNRVLLVIHVIFAMLQLTLLVLLTLSNFNFHVVLLNLIAAALWATLSWFIGQLEQVEGLDTRNYATLSENPKSK